MFNQQYFRRPGLCSFCSGGRLDLVAVELAVPLAMIVLITLVFPTLYRAGGFSIYEFSSVGRPSNAVRLSGIFQGRTSARRSSDDLRGSIDYRADHWIDVFPIGPHFWPGDRGLRLFW